MRNLMLILLLTLSACEFYDISGFIEQHKNSKKTKLDTVPALTKYNDIKFKAKRDRNPFVIQDEDNLSGAEFDKYLQDFLNSEQVMPNDSVSQQQQLSVKSNFKVTDKDFNINQHHPDGRRDKEYLEKFQLNTLKYSGYIAKNGYILAVILDPQDKFHYVQVGHYLGVNSGLIQKITANDISVREILPDGKGGWVTIRKVLKLHMASKDQNLSQTVKNDNDKNKNQ